jgi:hypothetical protein
MRILFVNKINRILLLTILSFISISVFAGQKSGLRYTYLSNVPELANGETVKGSARVLTLKNRKGINPTSIHTSIQLGKHTLNEKKGSLTLWFFALEDLATSFSASHMAIDNPHFGNYPFLSDNPMPRNFDESNFYFGWLRKNELRAQFHHGDLGVGITPPQKVWVQAVPFNYFVKNQWYQLCVTWDVDKKDARLYLNVILVGTSDRFNKDFYRDLAGSILYTGAPAICHGEIQFYDKVLSPEKIYAEYHANATDFNPLVEKELKNVFCGENLKDFTFKPDNNWVKKLDLTFKDPSDINHFYIQGDVASVKPNGHPDGLLIETPNVTSESHNRGKQVYIWSNQTFEGNIYIEFEWKALKDNGLSLLIFNASGMAREDFMADYPKKTSGFMTTVHGENVRNYHWEFYREVFDVRNDVMTAFSRKNPFSFRNSFKSADKPYEIDRWYKLQLLQIEGKILGAIDGKVMLEIDDNSRTNTGCILNYGHIAIRAMFHTKMLYRNLKVYNEKLPYSEEVFKTKL